MRILLWFVAIEVLALSGPYWIEYWIPSLVAIGAGLGLLEGELRG